MGRGARLNPFSKETSINLPMTFRDGKGRLLQPGDEVVMPQDRVIYKVLQIGPMLEPGAPPNRVRMILQATVVIAGGGGEQLPQVWLVDRPLPEVPPVSEAPKEVE